MGSLYFFFLIIKNIRFIRGLDKFLIITIRRTIWYQLYQL
nr:MAG TPA: hypothetical protein [Caudoviricetes sp.]